ncbi:MAG: type transport system ATP-binding protein [Frankiales bacterium]|nr:type transport system ATP-binding protein [Frankiales bacterium]
MKRVALLSSAALAAGILLAPGLTAQAAGTTKVTNSCILSVPDAGSTTPQKICYTLFQPPGTDPRHRVPLIFHSHGWGGSRTTDPAAFSAFLNAGYGVLSFDQRGFGEDGGKARIENPAYEGKDVEKLVELVSKLPWVQQDGPGDPHIGAIGGSYGGGYQFVGAFTEIADKHKQVFDALAPEITWWDLKQSLAPQGVTRTEWTTLLTAAGVNALPPEVLQGTAYGLATSLWPDGTVPGVPNLDAFFQKNGPAWQVSQGRRIDVPVLFGQGITDTLFPLHQGLQNFAKALTPQARAESIFVGYNGGHVLPNAFPQAVAPSSDPCSKQLGGGSFQALTVKFFDHALKGKKTTLTGYGKYHLATAGSTCTTVSSVTANASYPVGTVATTEVAGPPLGFKVVDGPIRVAGTPYLDGTVTALGVNNRAFFALGVGTSPADAKVVQGNVLPFASLTPVNGVATKIELPSVAVDVPAGQSLFVLAMATNDMFAGMGSRTPGAVVVQDAVVRLPVVS